MKREVRVQDAVGLVLAHDLTKIVPGEFKGRLFHKGHVVQEEDIAQLLSIGKEHVFVLTLEDGEVHEDDAAAAMAAAIAHDSLIASAAHEGKVMMKAAHSGLLTVDVDALNAVNELGELAIATRLTHSPVQTGQKVAAVRAIPLVVPQDKLNSFVGVLSGRGPLLQVLPYESLAVGIVTTGSEVFHGRITDRFGPVLRDKLAEYDARMLGQRIVDDKNEDIVAAIRAFVGEGADLILVTGGMSVDPDDRSPGAIRMVADEVITYGMPVLPGSMTMIAYHGRAVIMGLPGGVLYDSYTVFDQLLPRIMSGLRPNREDIARLGHGGLLT